MSISVQFIANKKEKGTMKTILLLGCLISVWGALCPATVLLATSGLVGLKALSLHQGACGASVSTLGLTQDRLAAALIFLMLLISVIMLINGGGPARTGSLSWLTLGLALVLALCFSCSSFLGFYLFFEVSLIPILFMIFGWGYQPERIPAGVAMMLYTMAASLPLLMMVLFLSLNSHSSMTSPVSAVPGAHILGGFVFLGLMLGFLVKFPLYSLHLWLPKAHVEAPVVGSMILAALLLKLGGYGAWRLLSVAPSSSVGAFLQAGALVGGALISILCLQQLDMKVLIAYSSVAHMSLAISCLLSLTPSGAIAAFFMMLAHGVSSSAMFAGANFIYLFNHSRNLALAGGLLGAAPGFAAMWFLACAGNMAAPPSVNLAAEIWSIISLLSLDLVLGGLFSLGAFLAAAYSLILYSSASQGQLLLSIVNLNPLHWKGPLVMSPHLLALVFSLFLFF